MPPKSPKTATAGRLIGYARVSTEEQGTDPQRDELGAAGCSTILEEHASGADRSRPVLARLLRDIAAGETLVVVRLDRLARSVSHLLGVIERLEASGAHFRSLRDPIDTTTPQGMFCHRRPRPPRAPSCARANHAPTRARSAFIDGGVSPAVRQFRAASRKTFLKVGCSRLR
jgi:hypothetical protein